MGDLHLLDTSFWVLSHRRRSPEAVLARSAELIRLSSAVINEVVRLELLMGYRDESAAAVAALELDALQDLPLTRPVWDQAIALGRRLNSIGLKKGFPDLLIAATSIHYDATLVHVDSDFEVIAQHSDLRTESYLQYLDV